MLCIIEILPSFTQSPYAHASTTVGLNIVVINTANQIIATQTCSCSSSQ